MELKSEKGRIQYVFYVLFVLIMPSALSQPPPPDVPQKEELVNLDSTLTNTTPSITVASGNDDTKFPTCSDLACTLEFIPEHCRLIPVLERNGVKCSGCWQWRDACKDVQNKTINVFPSDVTCPNLTCPNVTIPFKCISIETYEYKGKMCEKCPVYKTGCVPDSMPVQENIKCPVQACNLQLIPDECREISTFEHKGVMCKGCPKWRQGCESVSSQQNLAPRVSCPLMACDTYVPQECRVEREFQYRGRMCTQCSGWREGCREQERLNANFQKGNQRILPQIPCPNFPCIDNNIPAECKIEQPYEFRGRTCYKCPIRNPRCNIQDPSQRNIPELPPCPLVKCERPADIPPSCFQREFFSSRGKTCEKCPSIKRECSQFVPPRPNVQIDPAVSGRIGVPEIVCPLLRCPFLDIPIDCIDTPLYSYNGKMCQSCPKLRDGCVSSIADQMPPNSMIDFPQIPKRNPDIACPIKACPMIYIPAECKEEQPYLYMGMTCYDCPKQRESCIATNSQSAIRPENLQKMQCPMFGCPMIFIPPECRVERPFVFQGRTCYRCPQWREGCVPLPPKPNINNPAIQPLTTTESTKPVPKEQNTPEKSCPLMRCTKILIPSECREEQPYDYNGKVCYRCPKWKSDCLRRGNQFESTTTMPMGSIDTTNKLNPNDSPSITDLKEMIPVSKLINKVQAAACPPLRCPSMFIPLNCREESVYRYQGRECKGCPTWRLGCYPMSGAEMNMNANGILSFSLFNELLSL